MFACFFSLNTDILSNSLGQAGILKCFTANLFHSYRRRSSAAPAQRCKASIWLAKALLKQ